MITIYKQNYMYFQEELTGVSNDEEEFPLLNLAIKVSKSGPSSQVAVDSLDPE